MLEDQRGETSSKGHRILFSDVKNSPFAILIVGIICKVSVLVDSKLNFYIKWYKNNFFELPDVNIFHSSYYYYFISYFFKFNLILFVCFFVFVFVCLFVCFFAFLDELEWVAFKEIKLPK